MDMQDLRAHRDCSDFDLVIVIMLFNFTRFLLKISQSYLTVFFIIWYYYDLFSGVFLFLPV